VHGAVWVALKSENELSDRASRVANSAWYPLLVIAVAFLAYTWFATKLYDNYLGNVVLFIAPAIAVLSLLCIKIFAAKGRILAAFISSSLTILAVTFTGVIGLYPNLIPSSIDQAYSLTIFNSSSSPYTLKIMTIVALIFVPIVILYQIWTYRVFRHKVTMEEVMKEKELY
jgi:cytochrome bd ubiquinol oxidase subunit II